MNARELHGRDNPNEALTLLFVGAQKAWGLTGRVSAGFSVIRHVRIRYMNQKTINHQSAWPSLGRQYDHKSNAPHHVFSQLFIVGHVSKDGILPEFGTVHPLS